MHHSRPLRIALVGSCAINMLTGSAQSYPSTSVPWPVPEGGEMTGGVACGFNEVNGFAGAGDTGNQHWHVRDMNGDGLADLVVTSERNADGDHVTFDPGPTTHWNVHFSNGTGFEATATPWPLPPGGAFVGGTLLGFFTFQHSTQGLDDGSDGWTMEDLNGDDLPDLVVTGVRNSNMLIGFSPSSEAYWNAYLNTGSGFALTPVQWTLPDGGSIMGGVEQGYNYHQQVYPYTSDIGSDLWVLYDMNDDGRRDLVVTGEIDAVFDYPTAWFGDVASYWKVYLNNGSGYDLLETTWTLPDGGNIHNGDNTGYYAMYSRDVNGSLGSQQWAVHDMDGDGLADLVVTCEKSPPEDFIVFDVGPDAHWRVFSNTGSGFSTAAVDWPLPDGGTIDDGLELGYNNTQPFPAGAYDLGSLYWSVLDMNGDRRADLLVTHEHSLADAPYISTFGTPGSRYWRLHVNNGGGFDEVFTTWSLPDGGFIVAGENSGFTALEGVPGSGFDAGSEVWKAIDLDGSGTADLVVTSARESGSTQHVVFGTTGAHFWKVYWNPYWVGVPELQASSSTLQVLPNPATGPVYLELDGGIVREAVLHDVHGREVLRQRSGRIEVGALDVGLYLITVVDTEGVEHRARLVKE